MSDKDVETEEQPEIEEPKKKTEKEGVEQPQSFGRILGVIARRDPELYDKVKSLLEETGAKPSDIFEEAIRTYVEFSDYSQVNTKCLMASLNMLDNLLKRVVNLMSVLNTWISSAFFQSQIEILNNIKQQKELEAKSQPKQINLSGLPDKSREQLANFMIGMLTNLMTGLMGSLLKPTMGNTQMPNMNIQQPKPNVNMDNVKIKTGKK